MRFCGTPDHETALAANNRCQFPKGYVVKWCVNRYIPGFDEDDQEEDLQWSYDTWSDVCGIRYQRVPRSQQRLANIIIDYVTIDGPQGVLARHYLPCGNVTPNTKLAFELDKDERYVFGPPPWPQGSIPFRLVSLHESGHGNGVGHEETPGIVAVMDPRLNIDLDYPQQWDIDQHEVRYGPPVDIGDPTDPTPPLPPPVAGSICDSIAKMFPQSVGAGCGAGIFDILLKAVLNAICTPQVGALVLQQIIDNAPESIRAIKGGGTQPGTPCPTLSLLPNSSIEKLVRMFLSCLSPTQRADLRDVVVTHLTTGDPI